MGGRSRLRKRSIRARELGRNGRLEVEGDQIDRGRLRRKLQLFGDRENRLPTNGTDIDLPPWFNHASVGIIHIHNTRTLQGVSIYSPLAVK